MNIANLQLSREWLEENIRISADGVDERAFAIPGQEHLDNLKKELVRETVESVGRAYKNEHVYDAAE